MGGMATLTVVGNLGADPEVVDENEKARARMRVAVNGRKDDPPTWISVTVFGKQAENCGRYLAKGRTVAVSGRLEVRTYKAKDGTDRTDVGVVADSVAFVGGANEVGGADGWRGPRADRPSDEDIPF
jgi:single-strand DNA-binding protein